MVRKAPILICEMKVEEYRKYMGAIRSLFSRHVRVDIVRKRNEKGEKIVEIWSPYLEVLVPAIEKVTGKIKGK